MKPLEIRPSRALLKLRLGLSLIPALIPGVIVASIFARIGLTVLEGFAVGFAPLATLLLLYVRAHFATIHYEIDDRQLVVSSGLYWKVRRSTPLEKVTNVDVRQGPLERLHGISSIWIFTPSTGALTPEAQLDGIENPQAIKELILGHAAATGATEPASASRGAALSGAGSNETVVLLREIAASLKAIEAAVSRRQ